MVVLGAGDLSPAQTAGAGSLDALGAGAHGAAHGILHGAAEADTLLQLLGDILRHQLGVGVHIPDLNDLQVHSLAGELHQLGLNLLNVLAALADDHAGTGAMQVDADLGVVVPLDLDLGDAGAVEGLFQVVADLLVLHQQVAYQFVAGIPAGVPILDDAHAQAVGIDFLSHIVPPPLALAHGDGDVRGTLVDPIGAALGPGHDALDDGAGVGVAGGHVQLLRVHLVVVLRVGGGALQQLEHGLRGGLGGLHQDGGGGGHVLAPNQVQDDLHLTGRDPQIFQIGFCFHLVSPPYLPVLLPA